MSFTVAFTSGDPRLFRGDSARGFDSPSDRNSTLSRKYPYKCRCNVKLDLFQCTKALCQAQDVQEKGMRHKGCVLLLDNYFRIWRLRGGWNEMPLDAVCIFWKGSRPVFPPLWGCLRWTVALLGNQAEEQNRSEGYINPTATSHLLFDLVEFVGYLCRGYFQK